MIPNTQKLVDDFHQVAKIGGVDLPTGAIGVECLPKPHTPSALENGKMAVYVFVLDEQCLKVGKAGPNSGARYKYQHYSPKNSKSNLANSLLTCPDFPQLFEADIGNWIKHNTDRINFLIDASYGIPVLNLLEAFLQCKLKPKFEGFENQR